MPTMKEVEARGSPDLSALEWDYESDRSAPPVDETKDHSCDVLKFPINGSIVEEISGKKTAGWNYQIGIRGKDEPGNFNGAPFAILRAPAQCTLVGYKRANSCRDMFLLRLTKYGNLCALGVHEHRRRSALHPDHPETLLNKKFEPGDEIVRYGAADPGFPEFLVLPAVYVFIGILPQTALIEYPDEAPDWVTGQVVARHYWTYKDIPWTADSKVPRLVGEPKPNPNRPKWHQFRPKRERLPKPDEIEKGEKELRLEWCKGKGVSGIVEDE